MITQSLSAAVLYIKDDWNSKPTRLILEAICWIGNITVGLITALTVPNPPFLILYPVWLCCVSINIYSAHSRGSTGMLLAAISMGIIDVCGYVRLLTQYF